MGKIYCEHDVVVKVDKGQVITYCKKCGLILDTKPAEKKKEINDHYHNGGSGQILHG